VEENGSELDLTESGYGGIPMVKYGYRDEDGEWIDTPHGLNIALWPQQPTKNDWYCLNGHRMRLLPISLDIKNNLRWVCPCYSIPLWGRDLAFNWAKEKVIEENSLRSLFWDKETKTIRIESAIFTGTSRTNSKRHSISLSERERIRDSLVELVQQALNISFDSWSEFFEEGPY
jgi:hypothetical protein